MPRQPGKHRAGLRSWARRHAYSLLSSIGALVRHPLASGMTVAVLAIALSLPLGLYTALENLREIGRDWERLDTLSVFLHPEASEDQARTLADELRSRSDVLEVLAISPAEGLDELAGASGLGAAEISDQDNPLPWLLAVTPVTGSGVPALAERIRDLDAVDTVLVDTEWLARLDAMLAVLERLVTLLAVLFALGVLFVIANNVRADIQARREEIEVMALVGATPGFIRRPFLYSGLWIGLLGGALALALIHGGLALLAGPVAELAATYGEALGLVPPDPRVGAGLVVGGGVLGVTGAWVAVGRFLRRVNP